MERREGGGGEKHAPLCMAQAKHPKSHHNVARAIWRTKKKIIAQEKIGASFGQKTSKIGKIIILGLII